MTNSQQAMQRLIILLCLRDTAYNMVSFHKLQLKYMYKKSPLATEPHTHTLTHSNFAYL